MESKSFVKLLRKIIREEVSVAVKKAITESNINNITSDINLSEITEDPMPNRPRAKKRYTKNPMLNELLNETASTPASQELADWSSMNYKAEMAEAFGTERVQSNPARPLATKGINGEAVNMSNKNVVTTVNAMTKDYSALMKAINKKKGS